MTGGTVELPEIGTPVVLDHWTANSYPSRVEDIRGDHVTIGMPTALMAADDYEPGEPFELSWTLPSGVHVLPVRFVGARTEQRVRLWELSLAGEGWVDQRREYVRVPLAGSVTVGAGPAALHGELLDISEAALQCRLPVPYDDARLAPGTTASCQLTLRGDVLLAEGVVESTRPADDAEQARVVLRLELSAPETDALRGHVFAAQLEQRRARRER